jgi:hypothetical protein
MNEVCIDMEVIFDFDLIVYFCSLDDDIGAPGAKDLAAALQVNTTLTALG